MIAGSRPCKAIREAVHGLWIGGRTRHVAPFDDEDVESLALKRQLLFHGHRPGAADEQVGQQDAEPAVPGFVGAFVHG